MKVFKLASTKDLEAHSGEVPEKLVYPRSSRPSKVWGIFLFLAFGAGLLLGKLAFPLAVVQSPLDPSMPTPVPPTPTSVPTPTATSLQLGDALETLYIEIAPGDFAQLAAKREEALERWVLLSDDTDFVPATVRTGADEIPVDLRLKGDWADHFAHDKWSFRIETKGEHYLWGMEVFSIQDPSTRTYLNEWMFLENLRAEDVLGVSYRFVRVVLNGEYKGIYAVEEGFSKELLEAQRRREGVIIRYSEDLVWEYRAEYANDEVIPRGVNLFHIIDEFDSGRVNASAALSAQRNAAVGQLRALDQGERRASEVFDLEMMGKFLALSDVWGARHALIWHNVRYYYNPVTARLEPVGFDTQPLGEDVPVELVALDGLRAVVAYGDPVLQRAYLTYLDRFSQPEYLEQIRAQFGTEFEVLRHALKDEFGEEPLTPPWDALAQRQASLQELLHPYQMVYATMPGTLEGAGAEMVSLDLGNLLDFPVEVSSLVVGEQTIDVDPAWLDPLSEDVVAPAIEETDALLVLRPLPLDAEFMNYARLNIPASLLDGLDTSASSGVQVVTKIWGLTEPCTQTVVASYAPQLVEGPFPEYPTLAETLEQHSYLQLLDERSEGPMLSIPSGSWVISGNLVLPKGYGLYLPPGTTLRFGRENYLLASGPLTFQGNERAPVVLEPLGDAWRGILVIESDQPSSWQYAEVANTDAIDQEGWLLTGGITFYRSAIRLDHSRILGTQAEDGFNVIRAPFEFVDSEFSGTASDAFDADFGQGIFERCVFRNIGADAIDVSGSEVQVRDVQMFALGDKGLSVGEGSHLTAENVKIESSDFGVASKDLSQTTISNVTLEGVRIAGLAAYIKKPSYGPASITASQVTFGDLPADRHLLVQTGSWVDLDGVRTWGIAVDVDALYEKWKK